MSKQPINQGDKVRWLSSGKYAGRVRSKFSIPMLMVEDPDSGEVEPVEEDAVELWRPPTPEQAWKEASFAVLEFMKAHPCGQYIVPAQYSSLRHQMYVTLGSAGVKITDEVKREVRATIKKAAGILDLTVIED